MYEQQRGPVAFVDIADNARRQVEALQPERELFVWQPTGPLLACSHWSARLHRRGVATPKL